MFQKLPPDRRAGRRTGHRKQIAKRAREQDETRDAGDGQLQGEIVGRRRVDEGAGRGAERECRQSIGAARERGAQQHDGSADAGPDGGPGRTEQQDLERGEGKGDGGPEHAGTQAVRPRRPQPGAAGQLADQQRHDRKVEAGACEQMDEPARGQLVFRLARETASVADRQGGDERRVLRRTTDGPCALRESAAELVEPAPDARAAPEDFDHLRAALDRDAASRKLRPAIAAARVQSAGRNVHLPEEPGPVAAVDRDAAQPDRREALRYAHDVRGNDDALEFLLQGERYRLLLRRSAQEPERKTCGGGPGRAPEGKRQGCNRCPPRQRNPEKSAGKKCRARDQQWPDPHHPLPRLQPCVRLPTSRTRELGTLHPVRDRRQAHH